MASQKISQLTALTEAADADLFAIVDDSATATKKITKANLFGELNSLSDAEIQQIQNIGAVTITNAQWGYLGGLDQSLATTDSPEFGGLTLSGNTTIAGNYIGRDADNYLGFETDNQIDLKVNGTIQQTIDSAGIISMPNQSGTILYAGSGDAQVFNDPRITRILLRGTYTTDPQGEADTTTKTGTADGTVADHLQDDTNAQFNSDDVGRWVWNTTDNTYAEITAFNDSGDVTLDADIFVSGEGYLLYDSTFTAKEAGLYFVSATVQLNSPTDQDKTRIRIEKNGAFAVLNSYHCASGTDDQSFTLSGLVALSADDTIALTTYPYDRPTTFNSGIETILHIFKLR